MIDVRFKSSFLSKKEGNFNFNGDPENEDLLTKSFEIIAKYPKCTAYLFEWQGEQSNTAHYHNVSRYLGTEAAKNDWLFCLWICKVQSIAPQNVSVQ